MSEIGVESFLSTDSNDSASVSTSSKDQWERYTSCVRY